MTKKRFNEDDCDIMKTIVGYPFIRPSGWKMLFSEKLSTVTIQCPFNRVCERDDKNDYTVCRNPIKKGIYMNTIKREIHGVEFVKHIKSQE